MTTYTPGQRVCIKAKGIYSGGGNYRAPAVPGSPYSHLVLLDDGILVAFHDSEVEPIETPEVDDAEERVQDILIQAQNFELTSMEATDAIMAIIKEKK